MLFAKFSMMLKESHALCLQHKSSLAQSVLASQECTGATGSKPTMDLLLGTPLAGLAGAATPIQPPLLSVEARTHLHHPLQTLQPPTAPA